MTFMTLTPIRKFFITVIFLALVIGVVAVACVLMYWRVNAAVADLARLDAEIASRHKEQQQTGALVALLRNHRADFDRLRAFSVSRTNPVAFLKDFETLAAETHTVTAINLDNGESASDVMKFQFTIEGAEKNVAGMLALIEHAPYELTIDGISIQKISSEQGPPQMHLLINVHVKASP